MPNNDMGREENITNETFRAASEGMGMSEEESERNALDLLQKVLASRESSTEKNWIPK